MKTLNQKMIANCWSDEWQRTNPDFTVYLPEEPSGDDADNEHFLVTITPKEALLAIWTQGDSEGGDLQRVVYARSNDGGITWTKPQVIDGPYDDGFIASWGFPVVSKQGRIYCFYNKHTGIVDHHRACTGVMRCKYSDDDGHNWKDGGIIPFGRSEKDHPDTSVPPNWIVWQKPIRDSKGRQTVGFTRHSSNERKPPSYGAWQDDSQSEFIRFDNIDEGLNPENLRISWLQAQGGAVRVACPIRPEVSVCQEPSIVLLPDGRMFSVFRTLTGRIWYSVSDDDGASWRDPDVLRYEDGGEDVLHPISPCPIYALKDGRFLLLYHNNSGRSGGGTWPGDSNFNRNEAYIALGEFRSDAWQPIWFSQPRKFCESGNVTVGPAQNAGIEMKKPFRVEVATYTSLTEHEGKRVLWYPDRKHFLLGRLITDDWLAELRVPTQKSLYWPILQSLKETKNAH